MYNIGTNKGGDKVEIKDRIRHIRKQNKLNREEFAKKLGFTSDGAVTNMELGRVTITEERIDLICKTFGVNKEWLTTGEGEMEAPKTRDQEIIDFATETVKEPDTSIKKRLVQALAGLEPQQWDALEDFIDKMIKGRD